MSPSQARFDIVDFHNHHIPARFEQTAVRTAPASQRDRWEALGRRLSDEDLLLQDIREGDIDARVVNIPAQLIADAEGRVPHETIMAMNDDLAALAARHPGRIHGLASVDAYDGDRSGREAERAIRDLRLRGLFVDCARGDLMIDAPQARPTLEVAATLGVPVFVHPVAPQPLTARMVPYGLIGTLFARGTANSAALIALVEGGVFSQLPGLRVRVAGRRLAFGGLRGASAAGLSSKASAISFRMDAAAAMCRCRSRCGTGSCRRGAIEAMTQARRDAGLGHPLARYDAAFTAAGLIAAIVDSWAPLATGRLPYDARPIDRVVQAATGRSGAIEVTDLLRRWRNERLGVDGTAAEAARKRFKQHSTSGAAWRFSAKTWRAS